MNKISDLTVSKEKTIQEAMEVLNKNGRGICFVLDKLKIVGVITDGDIRRAILKGISINSLVIEAMNSNFKKLNVNSDDKLIRKTFSDELRLIPLCDDAGNLVDFADVLRSHRIPIMEPSMSGREMEYVQNCIKTNWISSQGKYVEEFENTFSKLLDNNHAVSVSNGTAALQLALLALGIKDGDEVIVPDVTFVATINTVIHSKATPIMCEINKETWCIDPVEIEKLVTKRTKAIIPVHLYGQVCEIDKIKKIALKHNLLIIEDCAEALGSEFNNKPVGIDSDAATFSFFGNKTISTGEGGMVVFKESLIANKARILRDHGMKPEKKYWHEEVGYNFRLTNIQAAIGVAQMERLSEIIEKKIEISKSYINELKDSTSFIKLPIKLDYAKHSHWLFTIILDKRFDRDLIIKKLMEKGIDSRPVFYSLHKMPPYKNYKYSKKINNSLDISSQGLSLPSSLMLEDEDIKYITDSLKNTLNNEIL
jgi:perosamine synthetase